MQIGHYIEDLASGNVEPKLFIRVLTGAVFLIGFMLGVLIRSSTGAIVAYFVITFVLPTIFGLLAESQRWFHDLQPWVDIQFAQSGLFIFDQALTGQQWAHIAVTAVTSLLVPLAIGLVFVMRAEVK